VDGERADGERAAVDGKLAADPTSERTTTQRATV